MVLNFSVATSTKYVSYFPNYLRGKLLNNQTQTIPFSFEDLMTAHSSPAASTETQFDSFSDDVWYKMSLPEIIHFSQWLKHKFVSLDILRD